MQRYCEMLRRKLEELRTDVHTFFRIAYCYKFGCTPDLNDDVSQFKMHMIVPIYVREYLDMLFQGEG